MSTSSSALAHMALSLTAAAVHGSASVSHSTANRASESEPTVVTLPLRYQCPLCFDVLRRPVLLPCCRRHLCLECFERALELTSVNCGFCRKRIVGFARKKQHKVDNALWNAILAKCPFIGAALVSGAPEDPSWSVEFDDEQAASQRTPGSQSLQPGELKQMYEQQVRARQSQLEQEQALALEKTMDFLQSDPEYLASVGRQQQQQQLNAQFLGRSHHPKPSRPAALHPDKAHTSAPKQQRLDTFFSHSIDLSSDSSDPVASPLSPHTQPKSLKRKRVELSSSSTSASESSLPKAPAVVQTTLFQLSSASSSGAPVRRRTSTPKIAPSDKRRLSKTPKPPSSEQAPRRTPWRCVQCTFENTCFDRQCSMCHAQPPPLP